MIFYGLKTYDTCRKALKDIRESGVEPRYVDIRADGVPVADLSRFLMFFGDQLINRRSTTWRNLSQAERLDAPLSLLQKHPTLMKRPVIERGETLVVGWTAATRAALM